jgi:hypothetical protein
LNEQANTSNDFFHQSFVFHDNQISSISLPRSTLSRRLLESWWSENRQLLLNSSDWEVKRHCWWRYFLLVSDESILMAMLVLSWLFTAPLMLIVIMIFSDWIGVINHNQSRRICLCIHCIYWRYIIAHSEHMHAYHPTQKTRSVYYHYTINQVADPSETGSTPFLWMR